MDSSETPRPVPAQPVPAQPVAPAPVTVRDAGELVAAVPVLLGFHPQESLVLIAMGGRSGRRLGLTLRADLPPPGCAVAMSGEVADTLLLDAPAGAVVIVLSRGGGGGGAHPPRSELVDEVARALEARGIEVRAALWATGTTAGARWEHYDPCGCSGAVPEPSTTPLGVAAVVDGQVVHADRAALQQWVAPADAGRIRRRERLLIRSVDEALAATDLLADPCAGGADTGAAAGRRVVAVALADTAAGRLDLDDARVLALASALALPAVRDTALLACAGPSAGAAEQLWTSLVRETPDPEAAEPAVLLAVSALLRGDGALANVALDRAERAWPGHHLAAVLRGVAEAGLRPAQVRDRVRQGIARPGGAGPTDGRGRRSASRR